MIICENGKQRIVKMPFVYDDGGRMASGYKGKTNDCAVRAVAIAAQKPYREVYEELHKFQKEYGKVRRDKNAKDIKRRGASPRKGIYRKILRSYLENLGWRWIPTTGIGIGCKIHLRPGELPDGRLIVKVSRHITAVINGVIHDTHECDRDCTRCVYGFWTRR